MQPNLVGIPNMHELSWNEDGLVDGSEYNFWAGVGAKAKPHSRLQNTWFDGNILEVFSGTYFLYGDGIIYALPCKVLRELPISIVGKPNQFEESPPSTKYMWDLSWDGWWKEGERCIFFGGGRGQISWKTHGFEAFSPSRKYIYRIFHETVGGKKARGVIFLGGVGVRSPEILMDLKRSPPQENTCRILPMRRLRRLVERRREM